MSEWFEAGSPQTVPEWKGVTRRFETTELSFRIGAYVRTAHGHVGRITQQRTDSARVRMDDGRVLWCQTSTLTLVRVAQSDRAVGAGVDLST